MADGPEIQSGKWMRMRLFLKFLVLIPAFGASLAFGFSPAWMQGRSTERLPVEVFDQKLQKTLALNTWLIAPKTAPPWQTVVLPSNCTGTDDKFWALMAPVLLDRDYAVVLLDSFTPRGFSKVCTDKFQMWQEARVADAVATLQALRADRRFSGDHIALGGHSNGAVTAFMSAFAESAQVVRTENLGYAAYFAVAGSCELTFKSTRLWAPLLIVSGEKDDYTLPEPCLGEASRLQAAGSPAEVRIIPGANHEMSTTGWIYSPRVQRLPKGLPRIFLRGRDEQGRMLVELEDGSLSTNSELVKKYGGFMLSKTFGATVGGDWDRFPEVSEAILKHLERVGFSPK